MKITSRAIWKIAAALGALLVVLAIAVVVVLQSSWFRDRVRRLLIAQVEETTGGKVELAGFDYDWRKLTADLHGFVIHGNEPRDVPPLLSVENARVTVKIISIAERSVDVSSIVLTRPQVNLIVAADGSTNLPTPPLARKPKKGLIQELFALKLNHFEIDDGLALVNEKRIPLNVRGDGVDMLVNYRRVRPSYEITLSSRQVDLGFGEIVRGPLSLRTQASLGPDRITIQNAELTGADSKIHVSGAVDGFAHPRGAFKLDATAATNEILPVVKITNIRGGKLTLAGNGSYDERAGWSFSGKVAAQQTGYFSSALTFKSISADADVDARKSGLVLRHLLATSLGARLTGEATLKNYRNLSLEGNISGLTTRDVGAFFTSKPIAWQGVASGRVHLTATMDSRAHDLALQSSLSIAPSAAGIPISGNIELGYQQKANSIDFGRSYLKLPHSEVSFSGSLWGQNQVVLNSTDLEDLKPILSLVGIQVRADAWPVLLTNGTLHYDGTISNLTGSPKFDGKLDAENVREMGQILDGVNARFDAGGNGIDFAALDLHQGDMRLNGTGLLGFENWTIKSDSPVRAAVALRGVDVSKIAAQYPNITLPIIHGIVSGSLQLRGTLNHPEGQAHLSSDSLDAYGERLNQAQFDASLAGDDLQISNGRVVSGEAILSFSGDYQHRADTWTHGLARIKVDSNGFPLASLSPVRKYYPEWNAQAEVHFETSAEVSPDRVEPAGANGTVDLRNVTFDKVPYGELNLHATTRGQSLHAVISGNLRKNPLRGTATVELKGDNRTEAEIEFDKVSVQSIYSLKGVETPPLFDGFMQAKIQIEGQLQKPAQMRATLRSDQLQLSSQLNLNEVGKAKESLVTLRNDGPLVVEAQNGVATVRSFRIVGDNTSLDVTGSIPYQAKKPMDLRVTGSVNLQAYHLFDPHVESSGISTIAANIGGTLTDPLVSGTLEVKNGTFFPENIPNGLSAVNGTVTFNRNRATLQKMTAKSGGGDLTLGGFLSFGGGGPLVYHLEGSAENVRVRYAGSISVTSSAKLRLSGTSSTSLLSGTLTISRVVFNPNTDVGNILAGLGSPGAASSDNDFLSGLHIDVVIESAPNLQLSTSLSRDVEAEINLRLRGTPDHPVLLGTLAANQGDIQAFGSRYSINRGEITFANPVKIEPALDLDLETRARGVTVDITISGTFTKLNIAYRSDPPLQPREIIALLAVGRTPDVADNATSLRTNDSNNLQAGANSLLGSIATSPVTNRLSKLFGISNIRIDPLVQGITNTPQTRVTLEQQITRDITITYITNLSQTSEQIFRFEWALNRQFSVVALRDDNGEFGIDFQYKKQFK